MKTNFKSLFFQNLIPLILAFMFFTEKSICQDSTEVYRDSTITGTMAAGESDADVPKRRFVKWNEYEGPLITARFGMGFLWDFGTYIQDENSKEHFDLSTNGGLRDFRLLLKGRLKFIERKVTYSIGYMYDGADKSWHFRQTGLMIAIPELYGSLFVGRTKEGFSLNKIMVGYFGWTHERMTMNDAAIQILADGVKWLGYFPKAGIVWNLGWFTDWVADAESFSKYDNLVVGRVAWTNLPKENKGKLLHVGIMGRYGLVNNRKINVRSKPEAFLLPYFIETGSFPAHHSYTWGLESYYRPGKFLFGTEYFIQGFSAPEAGNPVFHGGELLASWLITGEAKPYNASGGYFNDTTPEESIFEGGPGAVEAVLRFSYSNLDSGTLKGGEFWRLTPLINWYLSDFLRLEFVYGYSALHRFGVTSITQFFQSRIQLQF